MTVYQVLKHGLEVFEDKRNFRRWLQTRCIPLANRRPIHLMGSKSGRRRVNAVLVEIEHGIY